MMRYLHSTGAGSNRTSDNSGNVIMFIVHCALLITAVSAFLRVADCYCQSTTLYAGVMTGSKVVSPGKNEICSIYIRPETFYIPRHYYLEISWSSTYFDVKGNMPHCKEDYIEVYLTRSYRSIGKFCSNNAGKPFTMYSRDGFARITYHTDGYVTGKGFKFSYTLKGHGWGHLGSVPSSRTCYNTYNFGSSGVISSTGWPHGYKKALSSCKYLIKKPNTHSGTYVVFMDIDLNDSGYSYDGVQLYGSNSSRYTSHALSVKLTSTEQMKRYISYNRYTRIDLHRTSGPGVSSVYRGFVAGYIMFKSIKVIEDPYPWNIVPANDTFPTDSHSTTYGSGIAGVIVGILVPAIIIIFIVLFAVTYKRRQQGHNANSRTVNQPLYTAVPPQAQHGNTHEVMQPGTAVSSHTDQCYKPYYPYPTASMQTGNQSSASCPMQVGAPLPYPSGQATMTDNSPSQYAIVPTSVCGSAATEPLQPCYPTDPEQPQAPAGSFASVPVSSGHGVNLATVPVYDTLPSAPPPSYESVMRG